MVAPKEVIYTGGITDAKHFINDCFYHFFSRFHVYCVSKKKKAEIKGLKSALTSICFFSLAIFNLFAYWFQFGGMLTVLFSIVLLLVGAYFTKYIPISKKVH